MIKPGNHDANDWLRNESSGEVWNGTEPPEIQRDPRLALCLFTRVDGESWNGG